ncbi:MAG: ATP-binding cassette domain-containing protein [Firmicutes bacterium]|nr:ATP-binding cassette domain-containing protein [Bacillota bacterium]
MQRISKSFGPVRALTQVDLDLYPQEILGLVGDNAAGKSTLMKILAGVFPPDEGEIYLEGRRVNFATPRQAREHGIEMVYQDLALAPNLDVPGNVFLARELTRPFLRPLRILDKRRMEAEAVRAINRLRIDVRSPAEKVQFLSGGQRQAVAIARATMFNARVIIMDEPTASLSVSAIQEVLALIRQLRSQGIAVILISHRLQDVFSVADRIMVLKLGRRVAVRRPQETTIDEIIRLMVVGEPALASS